LHPDHFGDKRRTFLWEYSYQEQYDMISRSVEAFRKMVGENPLFFRAGKFGANDDTIAILGDLGIPFDSSAFYAHRWCKISNMKRTNSLYKISNSVTELPVSLFSSLTIGGKTRRLDQVDFACNPREYKNVLKNQQKIDENVILTSFFHSFSFFPHRKNPEKIKFSKRAYSCFVKNLRFLKENNITVASPKDVIDSSEGILENAESNMLPKSGGLVSQCLYLVERSWQIVQTNKKAKMLFFALGIAGIMIVSTLVFVVLKFIK
jgi:hypothetical protein